jgi:archaetidylinositol phosphate synthase
MQWIFTPPHTSWTHKLTRMMVRPLVNTPVTPNHLTTARLITGIAACGAFALGTDDGDLWGGVLWVVSCLLDRADGELARLSRRMSPGGHHYDYVCDVVVNGLVFLAIGVGLRNSFLGAWAPVLGVLAGGAVVIASVLSERLEETEDSGQKAYSGIAGFDFDDMLYLFAPAAWLGWFIYILIGAAAVAPVLAILTAWRLRGQRLGRTTSE